MFFVLQEIFQIGQMDYFCNMEKRIKVLYGLTIAVIITFCTIQCYWLYNRYKDALNSYEDHLYNTVVSVMHEDYETRRATQTFDISILTSSKMKVSSNADQAGLMTMTFDIYVVDMNTYAIRDTADMNNIVGIYEQEKPEGITKYSFEVDNPRNERDAYDALERFQVDVRSPFNTARIDSLLNKRGVKAKEITVVQADSMVWFASRINHTSKLRSEITVSYPYDIFEREVVNVTLAVGVSPVIMKMLDTLLISLVLSGLLITCLIVQIATIRKQHKLEKLRQDFIHIMIHELKRPISTLKMCVSFMHNDKLMQDKESKDAIISDSYNELDNLSSYFSKLRDLTFSDVTEIPLTLSAFNLHDAIEECIEKLSIPNGKSATINVASDTDIMVTADRMHFVNIISNLLENALKYSKEKVRIEISYRKSNDESITISVKDNGFGIPKSDCKYVFDKFFRSQAVTNKGILGMGLGLAYVKLLVSAHKGSIEVESEKGVGTVFTIKLPQ